MLDPKELSAIKGKAKDGKCKSKSEEVKRKGKHKDSKEGKSDHGNKNKDNKSYWATSKKGVGRKQESELIIPSTSNASYSACPVTYAQEHCTKPGNSIACHTASRERLMWKVSSQPHRKLAPTRVMEKRRQRLSTDPRRSGTTSLATLVPRKTPKKTKRTQCSACGSSGVPKRVRPAVSRTAERLVL